MMELTTPEDSDLAIDLRAIYTPFLSEAIRAGVTQSARGARVLYECVLSYDGTGVAELWVTAVECYNSLREGHKHTNVNR